MKKVMNFFYILVLFTAIVLVAIPAAAENYWVSVAHGDGGWGIAAGYENMMDAQNRAVHECQIHGGSNCMVLNTDISNCVAYSDSDEAYGYGFSNSRSSATSRAISECNSHSSHTCSLADVKCAR